MLFLKLWEIRMTATVISFSSAIAACWKGGRREQAVALLHKMRESGITANVISRRAAISTEGQ